MEDEKIITEDVVEEEATASETKEEKPKKKTTSLKAKASYKKRGSFFVLSGGALINMFQNRGMRFQNRFDYVEFAAGKRDIGSSGRLAFDIAFGLVKSGGYLEIQKDILDLFGVECDSIEDGIAYIKK